MATGKYSFIEHYIFFKKPCLSKNEGQIFTLFHYFAKIPLISIAKLLIQLHVCEFVSFGEMKSKYIEINGIQKQS